MRKIIAWEGREMVPGVIIEVGALTWSEPLPIVWSFQHDLSNLLGTARDLRREEDGSITAELDIRDDTEQQRSVKTLLENRDVSTTIFANELTERIENGKRLVFAGAIREVSVVLPDTVGWR